MYREPQLQQTEIRWKGEEIHHEKHHLENRTGRRGAPGDLGPGVGPAPRRVELRRLLPHGHRGTGQDLYPPGLLHGGGDGGQPPAHSVPHGADGGVYPVPGGKRLLSGGGNGHGRCGPQRHLQHRHRNVHDSGRQLVHQHPSAGEGRVQPGPDRQRAVQHGPGQSPDPHRRAARGISHGGAVPAAGPGAPSAAEACHRPGQILLGFFYHNSEKLQATDLARGIMLLLGLVISVIGAIWWCILLFG